VTREWYLTKDSTKCHKNSVPCFCLWGLGVSRLKSRAVTKVSFAEKSNEYLSEVKRAPATQGYWMWEQENYRNKQKKRHFKHTKNL